MWASVQMSLRWTQMKDRSEEPILDTCGPPFPVSLRGFLWIYTEPPAAPPHRGSGTGNTSLGNVVCLFLIVVNLSQPLRSELLMGPLRRWSPGFLLMVLQAEWQAFCDPQISEMFWRGKLKWGCRRGPLYYSQEEFQASFWSLKNPD